MTSESQKALPVSQEPEGKELAPAFLEAWSSESHAHQEESAGIFFICRVWRVQAMFSPTVAPSFCSIHILKEVSWKYFSDNFVFIMWSAQDMVALGNFP